MAPQNLRAATLNFAKPVLSGAGGGGFFEV